MAKAVFVAMLFTFFSLGLCVGWISAHQEVAAECERQGSFYVGKRDFTCSLKPGAENGISIVK